MGLFAALRRAPIGSSRLDKPPEDPHGKKYTFVDFAKYLEIRERNVAAANAIYCLELLFRAHIAAITTILVMGIYPFIDVDFGFHEDYSRSGRLR
jgi:hypothetical protein